MCENSKAMQLFLALPNNFKEAKELVLSLESELEQLELDFSEDDLRITVEAASLFCDLFKNKITEISLKTKNNASKR
jgi:uncharacterized membrane protein